MEATHHLVVQKTAEGLRLDHFLANALSQSQVLSRARIQSYIREGFVRSNGGRVVKTGYKVHAGDRIHLQIPEPAKTELIPEKADLQVLYQDDEIVVLNKPRGIVVHAGAGNPHGTLVEQVMGQGITLSSIGLPQRPGVVHRLDKGTSGVLVMAKTDRAHLDIVHQFASRVVHKVYLAVVLGRLSVLSGTIENRLGRHPRDRQRFASLSRGGRAAKSRFRVLGSRGLTSLVCIEPETGRTHQIRVHLSEHGYPILGDAAYGAPRQRLATMRWREEEQKIIEQLDYPLLHAYSLSFIHPRTRERVQFQAKLRDDFEPFIDRTWLVA